MHLDLLEVLRASGASIEREISIPAGLLKDEWELTEPVIGHLRVSNARQNVVVRGSAKTSVLLQCARCLSDFSFPVDLNLDVVVPLSTFHATLGAAVSDDDDDGMELSPDDIKLLFQEHTLDVDELVRQAIVLEIPIQPLCRPDCPGLPEAQVYVEREADPRLAALQKLVKPN